MLEKMGWKEGKGLGKNEDGSTAHIKVSYKIGSEGLGFAEKDNTADLAQEYEKVLSKLNSQAQPTTSSVTSSDDHSHKSKKVRHRYGKLLKGKVLDASSCSQKDLACIFSGNQVTKEQETESSTPSDPGTKISRPSGKKRKKSSQD